MSRVHICPWESGGQRTCPLPVLWVHPDGLGRPPEPTFLGEGALRGKEQEEQIIPSRQNPDTLSIAEAAGSGLGGAGGGGELLWLLRGVTTLPCFQVTPTEQGMKDVTQLLATYPQGFMTWQGPIHPLVILCHPDMVRALTNASGTHTELVVVGALAHLGLLAPPCQASVQPLQDLALLPSFLLASSSFFPSIQTCISPPPPPHAICF